MGEYLHPAARLLNERPRIFWGHVVMVFVKQGWRPPRPTTRIVDRITADMERITRERGGWMADKQPTLAPSPAQVRALHLLAEGASTKDIAGELHIGTETVKYHLGTLYEKLGARNAAHAVAIGMRRGLIS